MVAGVGEIVLDILIKDGKAMAAVPGGSVFNSMVSLGRTLKDVPVCMISQCGDDKVADIVIDFMARNKISTVHIERVKGKQSTVSIALLDKESNASYEFFRDAAMPAPSLSSISFTPSDSLLFGSFFAVDPKTRPVVLSLASEANNLGATIYYDINFRKSHTPIIEPVLENCSLSTIVRASDEDLKNLALSGVPSKYFILTAGKEPTKVFWNDITLTIPSPHITPISTIGAGDNFNAGFIYALTSLGITRQNLSDLGPDTLSQLVTTAHNFASAVCLSAENYVPTDFQP